MKVKLLWMIFIGGLTYIGSLLYVPIMANMTKESFIYLHAAVEGSKRGKVGIPSSTNLDDISEVETGISAQFGGVENMKDMKGWTYYCEKSSQASLLSVTVLPKTLEAMETVEDMRDYIALKLPALNIDTTRSSVKIADAFREKISNSYNGVWKVDVPGIERITLERRMFCF